MRRLYPDPAEVDPAAEIGSLDLVSLAHEDRPYTVTNFVLTVDGRATIHGRSGPIGSDTDTAVLVALRTRVDAVMIGAGTMRAERYGRVVGDPDKRERREREGLADDPLMVLVSDSLELPWEAELFTCGQGEVLVFTSSEVEPPDTPTPVTVERHEHRVDLVAAVHHLRHERGVRALLSEGGPHLHAQLVAADLVDELFITVAPKLEGGAGPGLVEGLPERTLGLELVWLLEDEGELFTRYRYRG